MTLTRSVPAILRTDLRRLLRDQFLLGGAAYILGLAIAMRWLVPWLQAEVLASTQTDITPWLPLGTSYFMLINTAVLTGLIGGFLLLEQREERTIRALLVCPTPLGVSIGVLATMIVVVGTVVTVVEALVVGVGAPPRVPLVVSAVLCAPSGIVMALILATIADNKVEAFAALKIVSVLGMLPAAAWFVPEPWQVLAGVMPPYWACRIWWDAAEGRTDWAWMVVPGVLVTAIWVWALTRRFQAVAAR